MSVGSRRRLTDNVAISFALDAVPPVAAHDQDVADAAVGQLGADPDPELRAFAGLQPDPEHVLDAVEVTPTAMCAALFRTCAPSWTLATSASR